MKSKSSRTVCHSIANKCAANNSGLGFVKVFNGATLDLAVINRTDTSFLMTTAQPYALADAFANP